MKIKKVPTGEICIMKGDNGLLEFLSIGDYGKEKNIKADFLNLTKDINSVEHGDMLPLSEKWVTTISSQYGCSMDCVFCDVPKVGKGINATLNDLTNQVINSLKLHPEIECTKRFNLHYARMGEPTFNFNVIEHAKGLLKEVRPYIGRSIVHPVVSTMMPKNNKRLMEFLQDWCEVKNDNFRGNAGLQISINSTDDKQRKEMFSDNAMDLNMISGLVQYLPNPKGRKYTLNFALADDYIIDPVRLRNLFSPKNFIIKITPMHLTKSCIDNNLQTSKGYELFTPYKKIEKLLKEFGFDVIVFIPSKEEDGSMITCGNAILSQDTK